MNQLIPRQVTLALVVAAILMPIAISVVLGVSVLLDQMGDELGAAVLGRISLGLGLLWTVDLVSLVLALGIAQGLCGKNPGSNDREP